MKNEKRERFLRIAEARTNKVIKAIQLLTNCSNRAHYEYDGTDVKLIFKSIDKEIKESKEKFFSRNQNNFKFTFKKT